MSDIDFIKEMRMVKKDVEWCHDWLDIGYSKTDQENQLKVLVMLGTIKDRLDVLLGDSE